MAHRHLTNAAVENLNRQIWKELKCLCERQEHWDKYLQTVMLAHRSTVSVYSTKFTPFETMFGRCMRLPTDNSLIQAEVNTDINKQKYKQHMYNV